MKLRNFGDNDLGLTHFSLLSTVTLCNKTLLIQGVIFPQIYVLTSRNLKQIEIGQHPTIS